MLNISSQYQIQLAEPPERQTGATLPIKYHNVETICYVLSYYFSEQAWSDTLKAKRKTAGLSITSIKNLYIVTYFSNSSQHCPIRVQATMEQALMS